MAREHDSSRHSPLAQVDFNATEKALAILNNQLEVPGRLLRDADVRREVRFQRGSAQEREEAGREAQTGHAFGEGAELTWESSLRPPLLCRGHAVAGFHAAAKPPLAWPQQLG